MNDIKVSLSITIPGRQMIKEKDCVKRDYTYNSIIVHDRKSNKREKISFMTRNCIPAKRSIQIMDDTYYYMIDKKNCPVWEKNSSWNKMNAKERLESHMKRLCEFYNGSEYSYSVFEK